MATPRKHWFRISDSILREPWTRDEKMTLVMLCAWLNQRWARDGLDPENACRATLSRAALAEITGRVQLRHALNSLRALSERISLSIRVDGEFVVIEWPKFAEFQGLASRSGEKTGQKSPPPHTHTQDAPARRKTQEGEGVQGEQPAAPASPGPRLALVGVESDPAEASPTPTPKPDPPAKLIPKPESFPPDSMDRLRAWGLSKGFGPRVLNAGLERFREWDPLKRPRRKLSQWESAFMRITREGVEDGKIAKDQDQKPKGQAYEEWRGHQHEAAP